MSVDRSRLLAGAGAVIVCAAIGFGLGSAGSSDDRGSTRELGRATRPEVEMIKFAPGAIPAPVKSDSVEAQTPVAVDAPSSPAPTEPATPAPSTPSAPSSPAPSGGGSAPSSSGGGGGGGGGGG